MGIDLSPRRFKAGWHPTTRRPRTLPEDRSLSPGGCIVDEVSGRGPRGEVPGRPLSDGFTEISGKHWGLALFNKLKAPQARGVAFAPSSNKHVTVMGKSMEGSSASYTIGIYSKVARAHLLPTVNDGTVVLIRYAYLSPFQSNFTRPRVRLTASIHRHFTCAEDGHF
jgi:hypothetical protein